MSGKQAGYSYEASILILFLLFVGYISSDEEEIFSFLHFFRCGEVKFV